MPRRVAYGLAFVTVALLASEARAQAHTESSVGDVSSGVYRSAMPDTTPVRFELRGRGSERIGITPETDDPRFATFTPACATPCTLWFEPGRHFVALGFSPLRERPLELDIDRAPLRVRFSRDDPFAVVAGVIVAGAGVVAMVIDIPLAATSADSGPFWGVAGGGLVLFGVGAAVTFTAFGNHQIAPMP